jgi:serine protease AprX
MGTLADGPGIARVRRVTGWRLGRRGFMTVLVAITLVATSMATVTADTTSRTAGSTSVIVLTRAGQLARAMRQVVRLGGTVTRPFREVGGFAANLRSDAISSLLSSRAVLSIAPDRRLELHDSGWRTSSRSFSRTLSSIEADGLVKEYHTGRGIDVALIDSGVTPMEGLATAGKIVNGPDLSFDLQAGAQPYIDSYGHGTHLAGIIAGRDSDVRFGDDVDPGDFVGVAPGARIVNVKVAGPSGETDVSQVIAAIAWVVQHRNSDGLNIRVLNLAFGTDGQQGYQNDPLAYATEVAWRHGIVVVAAAGNAGGQLRQLDNPAYDPFVIAVGADDTIGTTYLGDDAIPDWSSVGDGTRNPDLVAPGVIIRSLRAPGSLLDRTVPVSAAGTRWIGGSGTSQAAAVVSGAAAVLLQDRPQLTPDQVKALLTSTANGVAGADPTIQGAGLLDVEAALDAPTPSSVQTWEPSRGTGSIEASRGSTHVAIGGIELRGDHDIFGAEWDSQTWAAQSADASAWTGGAWHGSQWTGDCLCQSTLSGLSWSGLSWSGLSWSTAFWGEP